MELLDFERFVAESRHYQYESKKAELLGMIVLSVSETMGEKLFAQMLVESDFYSTLDSINEESIADKMKRKYDAAIAIMKEKGKSALSDAQEKIVKFSGNIVNVIKLIAQKIAAFLKDAWNEARSAASSAVAKVKSEIEDKIESIKDKTNLEDEISAFKDMAKGGVTWAISGFPKEVAKAEMQAVKVEESLEILFLESALEISKDKGFMELFEAEDGIPFLSAIAHKIAEFPPFDLLHKISSKVSKVAKNSLDRASIFFNEVAGTPIVKFVVLPTLIGVAAEYMIKKSAVGILAPIPGIGTIASIIGTVALGLAVVTIAESMIKTES